MTIISSRRDIRPCSDRAKWARKNGGADPTAVTCHRAHQQPMLTRTRGQRRTASGGAGPSGGDRGSGCSSPLVTKVTKVTKDLQTASPSSPPLDRQRPFGILSLPRDDVDADCCQHRGQQPQAVGEHARGLNPGHFA